MDGIPAGNLQIDDLRAAFGENAATILALHKWLPNADKNSTTDVLVVVPPLAGLENVSIQQLIAWMIHAEALAPNIAVLGPDGQTSDFTRNPAVLQSELLQAMGMSKHLLNREKWPLFERNGFLALRRLPGRHVIINLTNPVDSYHSVQKSAFQTDRTLDVLSSFDMTQIYRLVAPVPMSSLIPMGDAATEHEDIGPGNHGQKELNEVQTASEQQNALDAAKANGNATGGRSETALDTLLADISADAQGSYELLVQLETRCDIGGMYSVAITARSPGVRVFAPVSIQMIPVSPLPNK